MYRLGERVRLDLPEPYTAAVVEVDKVVSRNVAAHAVALATAFEEAETGELDALLALYTFVVAEARPTWDLVEPRGPVPPTAGGFLRLPTDLAMSIFEGWLDTITPAAAENAAASRRVRKVNDAG